MGKITVLVKNFIKRYLLVNGYCKSCGKTMIPIFWVSDDLWDAVTNYSNKEYCLRCFDKMARKKEIMIEWRNRL